MSDFSHLSRLPLSSLLGPVLAGHELSDDYFDHLLDRIEPPLFDALRMTALRAELCWFAPRALKGRPRNGFSRAELAAAIRHMQRDDVPAPLLEAICLRLSERPSADRLRKPRAAMIRREKQIRLSLMRGIYANLLEAALGGKVACHPLLAEKAQLLLRTRRPHAEALKLTQEIMRDHLRLCPPGLGRMRNLVCGKVPAFS